MSQVFDINHWIEQRWWSTGGTRNKKIYINPEDNALYYFKQSLIKENRDYRYEFWSEIIASEIGLAWGFDVLPYHLAIREREAGCLSKSMIDPANEELVEGGKYIKSFDNTFNPDDKKLRSKYDFDLIIGTLEYFGLERYKRNVAEILVFDALIGNSDRHQENWAMITEHSNFSKMISSMERSLVGNALTNFKWINRAFQRFYLDKDAKGLKPGFNELKIAMAKTTRFAPIYDSGCSFGRELSEDRVNFLLQKQENVDSYLRKGESEIHWEEKKLNHFDLLKNLLAEDDFAPFVRQAIKRVNEKFDYPKICELITSVDVELPPECGSVKIPENRKELICNLTRTRYETVKSLL